MANNGLVIQLHVSDSLASLLKHIYCTLRIPLEVTKPRQPWEEEPK
jgi:hypothetical protein